ncbi:MAG TPA: hypothetical protein VFE61_16365 [Candidatus Sulfotelmatobacter sp.]|jgi:hypothetical protein|nr:hypothetical protein [Candidatus Sulfotelmatobacter sp.]
MTAFLKSFLKLFVTTAIVLVAASLWAQETYHAQDADLLARLSYHGPSTAKGVLFRQVCVAVSRDGEYRMVRSLNDGQMQRMEGKMPKEQLQKLSELLASAEFRSLSGDHSGLIRQMSESFGAEIPHGQKRPQRVQWLNADGESPFPDSVGKVVEWLTQFEPKDGKEFEYAADVCPSGGLHLLQPSVAENQHP